MKLVRLPPSPPSRIFWYWNQFLVQLSSPPMLVLSTNLIIHKCIDLGSIKFSSTQTSDSIKSEFTCCSSSLARALVIGPILTSLGLSCAATSSSGKDGKGLGMSSSDWHVGLWWNMSVIYLFGTVKRTPKLGEWLGDIGHNLSRTRTLEALGVAVFLCSTPQRSFMALFWSFCSKFDS